LQHLIREKNRFPENVAKFYIAETILAVEHLHKVGTLQSTATDYIINRCEPKTTATTGNVQVQVLFVTAKR
jgi:hypothetical protein